jgi:hypothetical protein
VNPEGLPTSVQFRYGPVLPDTPFAYTGATATQVVGPDFSDHPVTATATGLLPNTTYRAEAVATSSAGTATGPVQTLTTPADPLPPAPVLGKSFNVRPVSGLVLVKLREGGFVPLTEVRQLPGGTEVDARLGTIGNGARWASLSSKVLQTLRASAHGKVSTRGRYSAATVRGTVWSISDRCDGTLVTVQRDTVSVQDFVRHITILLHARQSYLARAPGRRGRK